jgi:hypothetical protein
MLVMAVMIPKGIFKGPSPFLPLGNDFTDQHSAYNRSNHGSPLLFF